MSIAEKLTTIAENQQAVYDAGKQAEYDAFWDAFQDNGNRTLYESAFFGRGWTNETFKPKYDIKPTRCFNMFTESYVTDLVAALEECGVVLDLSTVTGRCDQMFSYAGQLTTIPALDIRKATYANGVMNGMFRNCPKLHTIQNIHLAEDGSTTFGSSTFLQCYELKNITISGTIGQNGLSFSYCTNLTHDSLMSIINALADYRGDGLTHTITLGTTNLENLTDAEKAIATDKGWTLA